LACTPTAPAPVHDAGVWPVPDEICRACAATERARCDTERANERTQRLEEQATMLEIQIDELIKRREQKTDALLGKKP
jgi:hypothetical protein